MRAEARGLNLDRTPWHMTWVGVRPQRARRQLDGARVSARSLPVELSWSFRRRAPRHGCQPCLRESRPRAASRRHYPRVRVALVGGTHSSRAVRPSGTRRAPATNAACVCVFEATMAPPPPCITDRSRGGLLMFREEQEVSPSPPAWAATGGRQPLESRTARPLLRSNGQRRDRGQCRCSRRPALRRPPPRRPAASRRPPPRRSAAR